MKTVLIFLTIMLLVTDVNSENNEIISDNYKITKDQKIGIIPPIGGG